VTPVRIASLGFWLTLVGINSHCPAKADDSQSLEEIVVTGTRIARPNFDTASPIVVLPAAAFERTGSSTVEPTLNRYPLFVPGYTDTSNNTGNLNSYSDGRRASTCAGSARTARSPSSRADGWCQSTAMARRT